MGLWLAIGRLLAKGIAGFAGRPARHAGESAIVRCAEGLLRLLCLRVVVHPMQINLQVRVRPVACEAANGAILKAEHLQPGRSGRAHYARTIPDLWLRRQIIDGAAVSINRAYGTLGQDLRAPPTGPRSGASSR